MDRHRYKQIPIRLNERDFERLAIIKQRYECTSTTQAIRLAIQMLAEQPTTPFETKVNEELLRLQAKAEARQRYATEQRTDAVTTAPHSASDMFEEMGL